LLAVKLVSILLTFLVLVLAADQLEQPLLRRRLQVKIGVMSAVSG